MPGYHCVCSALSTSDGQTVRSTMRPNRCKSYGSPKAAGAFDLPMDDLTELAGEETMDYEQHRQLLQSSGGHYWIGQVMRNYDRGLDFYVEFKGDAFVYKYTLTMPDYVQEAENLHNEPNYEADGVYPAPSQWYLATGKNYVTKYSAAEWAAMGDDVTMTDDSVPAISS